MGKFLLIDGNNFFVSCERIRNPDLINKPVLVLASNGGAIVARSNEAKELGFKMGEPIFKIKDKITYHKVITLNGDHEYYSNISTKLMNKIKEFSNNIEVASIDEAFLYINHLNDNYLDEFSRYIINEIYNDTAVPVSIGIGKTKTLAKTANYIAKQSPECKGVYFITKDTNDGSALKFFPISDIWGCGKALTKKLHANCINTVYDFVKLDNTRVRNKYGLPSARIHMELKGIICYPIVKPELSKSITSSKSLKHTTQDKDVIMQEIIKHITSGCNRLKQENLTTSRFTVSISNSRFRGEYVNGSLTEDIPSSTNAISIFIKIAQTMIDKLYHPDIHYKKTGIEFSNLVSAKNAQQDLFNNSTTNIKLEKLDEAVNSLKNKFGKDIIKFGK